MCCQCLCQLQYCVLAQRVQAALRRCHVGFAQGHIGHGDGNTPWDLYDCAASEGEPGLERNQPMD